MVISIVHSPTTVLLCVSYISQSLLSQRAERQDDSNDGHPLQHTVHSYTHTKQEEQMVNH